MLFKAVITTIAEPTEAMKTLSRRLLDFNASLIAIGDTKGPQSFDLPNADFLPIEKQLELPFDLSKALPTRHYARKNIGYLKAIADKATVIYETDDDNAPLVNWTLRSETVNDVRIVREHGWTNVYKYFTMAFSVIALICYIRNIKVKDKMNLIMHLRCSVYCHDEVI